MNILAPASSFETVRIMIKAGADEIYVGADEEIYNVYSFTGRGKISPASKNVLCDFGEIKTIVEYAHEKNVRVNFLGNTPFFHDGEWQGEAFEKQYLKYIEKSLYAGVDSVVIGDIGLLNAVSKQNYDVALHASLYLKTLNCSQVDFLKSFGVKRVTLPYHITMNEISELCSREDMEFEVVGYLGCSFFNGGCSFLHAYGEGVLGGFAPGVSCKNVYEVLDDRCCSESKIFDCEAACALCSLKSLDENKVTALKIVGRDRDHRGTAEVIKLYRQVLDSQGDVNTIIPDWWKRLYCKTLTSCKYLDTNENYMYLIGVI